MVANRRQGRVLWLHDNLIELATPSICSVRERWRLIFEKLCWRPERGEVTGASAIVTFTVAKPQAMNKHANAVYCDVVLHLSTWCICGKRPSPARLPGPVVNKWVRRPALGLIQGEDLFTPSRYPRANVHESHRRRESRRELTGGEVQRT